MYLSIYLMKHTIQLRWITIKHAVYSRSSIVHLSSYYQAYVAKSQGRRRHMGKGVDRSQTKGLTLPGYSAQPWISPDRPHYSPFII